MFYLCGEYNNGTVTFLGERVGSFMILENDKVTENPISQS